MFRAKSVWVFLLPGGVLLLLFYLLPFFGGVRYSLLDGSFSGAFVGLANYSQLFANSMFQLGLKNTLLLSLVCAPLLWLLSFLFASGLARVYPRGSVARSAVLLPYLAPASAVILIWQLVFDVGGPLNRLAVALGGERVLWLAGPDMRVPVVVMFLWRNLGLGTVIFLSAMRAIPASLYESAELDGIRPLKRSLRITLPLCLPTAYLVFLLGWINTFKIFREVYFLSGAYPDPAVYTLQHYMNNVYSRLNYQLVTSAAYSFAVIVLALFGLLFFLQQRAADALYG